MGDREQSLLATHEARVEALVAGNLDDLAQIVGEDLVFVSATGKVMHRPEIFAAFKAGTMKVERIDADNVETRLYGDTAILSYRAHTTVRDGDNLIDGMTQNTCVFVFRDERWQMVNQHQCAISGG
ncbi:MAG: nuclear transport factor 2 family protein [Rhizobiales bacterium]|nr:nuclear transport factor 2 family protein [Hyphomicrobiales bacterium]